MHTSLYTEFTHCIGWVGNVNQHLTVNMSYALNACTYRIAENFSLVQSFAEMCPDSSEEILRLLFLRNRCVMLWPHPYQSTGTPTCKVKKQDKERQSEEASLYNNGPVFLLCGGRPAQLWKYQDCHHKHCWSQLRNFRASLIGWLAFCMVEGWFFFIVTIYRPTDCREPSSHGYWLVLIYTIMTLCRNDHYAFSPKHHWPLKYTHSYLC